MSNNELAQQLADNIGVDVEAVNTLAKMCADRIESWGAEVDNDSVSAAVMDSNKSYKHMCIRAHMHSSKFAEAIYDKVAQ